MVQRSSEPGHRLAAQQAGAPAPCRPLCAGHELDSEDAAAAAALFSERDIRSSQRSLAGGRGQAEVWAFDVSHLPELWRWRRPGGCRGRRWRAKAWIRDAVQMVERGGKSSFAHQAERGGRAIRGMREQALQKAPLAAYPIGWSSSPPRPAGETAEFVLAAGGSATLRPVAWSVRSSWPCSSMSKTAPRRADAAAGSWFAPPAPLKPIGCRAPATAAFHETAEPQWNSDAERVELVRRPGTSSWCWTSRAPPGWRRCGARELLVGKLQAAQLMIFSDGEFSTVGREVGLHRRALSRAVGILP